VRSTYSRLPHDYDLKDIQSVNSDDLLFMMGDLQVWKAFDALPPLQIEGEKRNTSK